MIDLASVRTILVVGICTTLMACSGTEFGSIGGKKAGKSSGDEPTADDDNDSDEGSDTIGGADADDVAADGDSDGDGDSSTCVSVPGGGKTADSELSGDKYRSTYFHRNVAVDPAKSGNDPSKNYGLKPMTISPDDELSRSTFEVSSGALRSMIADDVDEIEYFAFAHQFASGHDKISIKLETPDATLSDVSTTNIYSAYGYVSIRDLELKNGVPHATVDIFSFNYDPNGTSALDQKLRANPSVQDATNIVGPASEATKAKISKSSFKLPGFKLTIDIGANNYDSVQYRAVRANVWSAEPQTKAPKLCP